METLIKFRGQNELEFIRTYSTKQQCYAYLYEQKWSSGFSCPHCGSKEEHSCKTAYYKRCKQCLLMISPTAHTLFHKVKFGIEKAFYIVFKMSATTKSISAEQLAKTVGINRKSALAFQHKVRIAMKSSGNHPLEGQLEVDEAFIGQQEEVRGRGAVEKSQIVVAVEKQGDRGIKRVYALKIANASAAELKTIFEKHISAKAKVLTDKWKGYSPFMNAFNITQEKSEPDKNFKVMHRCVLQLKSWIRGIHHRVNPLYLQGYLDEFCYRINRSIHKETIVDNLLTRMVKHQNVYQYQIKFAYSN